jgi:hypothetical protein
MKVFTAALAACCAIVSAAIAVGQLPSPSPTPTIDTPTSLPTPPPTVWISPVIGSWIDNLTNATVTFKQDGTVQETTPSGGICQGYYAWVDDINLRIQPCEDTAPSGAYIATVVIAGAQLQLVNADGTIFRTLTRAQSLLSTPTPSPTASPL